jgi:hypothetical protein
MYHFTHTLERDEDIDVEVSYEIQRGRFVLTEVTLEAVDLATTGDEDADLIEAARRDYDDRRWDCTA